MSDFNTNETEEEFLKRIMEELRQRYQGGGFKGTIDPKPVPQPPRETR